MNSNPEALHRKPNGTNVNGRHWSLIQFYSAWKQLSACKVNGNMYFSNWTIWIKSSGVFSALDIFSTNRTVNKGTQNIREKIPVRWIWILRLTQSLIPKRNRPEKKKQKYAEIPFDIWIRCNANDVILKWNSSDVNNHSIRISISASSHRTAAREKTWTKNFVYIYSAMEKCALLFFLSKLKIKERKAIFIKINCCIAVVGGWVAGVLG